MSFHLNNVQQMAINDSLLSLTERETKYLKNSWTETFSKKKEEISSNIFLLTMEKGLAFVLEF